MAYCTNCGNEINENAPVCANCGTAQPQAQGYSQPQDYSYVQSEQPEVVDKGGFLWGLLGCCVPVVGLILFLVWKDTKPKTSKSAGIGALVGVISVVLIYVLFIVLGVVVGMSGIIYY